MENKNLALRDSLGGDDLDVLVNELNSLVHQQLRKLRIEIYQKELNRWDVNQQTVLYYSREGGIIISDDSYNDSDIDSAEESEGGTVDDSYAIVKLENDMLVITFTLLLYDEETTYKPNLRTTTEGIMRISNYGIPKMTRELTNELKKERITLGDRYTLLIKSIGTKFGSATNTRAGIHFRMDTSSIAFRVTLSFDMVDEREYAPGGGRYEQARSHFQGRGGQ